jgi:hypothetical protein
MTRIYIEKIEEFYPYRRALLNGHFFSCTLTEEDFSALSKAITRQGYKMDNHICWKTESGICMMYSDGHLYMSHKLIVEKSGNKK